MVEIGFGFVVGGEAELQVEPVDTKEQGVEAIGIEAGLGLRTLQRQGLLAQQSTGQAQFHAGRIREFPGDVEAVGHHDQVAVVAQMARQHHGG